MREANNSKDEELKKRFDYIKGVLKGEEKPSKSRSPQRQDTAPNEKAPQKKDSQGQGSQMSPPINDQKVLKLKKKAITFL